MPQVLHSWRTENDDANIEKWFVYVSASPESKGVKVAEVVYGESEAEFELIEGTWYIRVLGRLKDGSEHDWQSAHVAKEVIDAQAAAAPDITDTEDTEEAAAVVEVAPERSVVMTIDPPARDEPGSIVQIIQGDADTGKLIAEVPVEPRGPVGRDRSRQISPPIPVEGLGRTGQRNYAMRPMTKAGIPAPSAAQKVDGSVAQGESIHYPVVIASLTPGTAVGMATPTAAMGYTLDATHGVLLAELPTIAAATSDWGASLSSGLLASLPAFVPYVNKATIYTSTKDLGATATDARYTIDIYDDIQRVTAAGFADEIDIAGLSPYPFHPASSDDVRQVREGPPWAARETMTDSKARQPLRHWKWQVYTSVANFTSTSVPGANWVTHIPGRMYHNRYVAVRLVLEDPVGWHQLKVPNLMIRAMFHAGLTTNASGTPEAVLTRPPGSLCVDVAGAAVYVKTSGVGNAGWEQMAKQSAAMPTGAIIMYGAQPAPAGWLDTDGAAVSRTTYAALFAVIGTTFGVGDGSTTFNLPDMRDTFPQAAGPSNALATTGGAVSPSVTDPGHTHTVGTAPLRGAGATPTSAAANTGSSTTGITIGDGRPPFVTVHFIIKT